MAQSDLKTKDILNVSSFDTPEHCSLYRAVCYIAFSEKPIEEKYAEYLYEARKKVLCEEYVLYFTMEENGRTFFEHEAKYSEINAKDKVSFEAAANALRIKLIEGSVSSTGVLNNKSSPAWDNPQYAYEFPPMDTVFYGGDLYNREVIPKEAWESPSYVNNRIDWGLNTLTYSVADSIPEDSYHTSILELMLGSLSGSFHHPVYWGL